MTSGIYERTPKTRAKMSVAHMGHSVSVETRVAIKKGREESGANEAQRGVPRSPETRANISAILVDSDANKAQIDTMRGGDDIVYHHTLYDHSDLTKNRVKMRRSSHTMGHNVLRELGIGIPHINMRT